MTKATEAKILDLGTGPGARKTLSFFKMPIFVLAGLIVYGVFFRSVASGRWFAIGIIVIGSFNLFLETFKALVKRQFALDYIAITAILVSVLTGEYLVGLVIVLMLSGGTTLEKYGLARAKQSLTSLTNRIPNEVVLWQGGRAEVRVPIEGVAVGTEILVRKGEVVPLDGELLSKEAVFDESSLTGEPYIMEKVEGDQVRSGTVNQGEAAVVRVTKPDRESTYRKIIELVKRAQAEKAPLLRLANRYSIFFTVLTAFIAGVAYAFSRDINLVLAVLVVATPCPLILATPIALFGGMNVAARNRILVKNLTSFEALARATVVVLDKTGTITLGRPVVNKVEILNKQFDRQSVLGIAEAIERNSLHPLAKAIVEAARQAGAKRLMATNIVESLGSGISATIHGRAYTLAKMSRYHHSNAVELQTDTDGSIARFEFEDRLKGDSADIIKALKQLGFKLYIFTGDREENAKKIIANLGAVGSLVTIRANCTPEQKKDGVVQLKQKRETVAMVGDGINDAPALAAADIGMVFSNEEHTAASEAADVIFLGGDLSSVTFILRTAKRTIRVALQSIWCGIGLSVLLMVLAAAGQIPPLVGAVMQEGIDVLVIINALRASIGRPEEQSIH
ncbi:MAG: cadmium-translocating P-type ATPase [Candidatus Magasanikbacteria bacterium]|nr:cadmium-translocating P-type ATPase [Candidatus Magasanikbacteria bacterium]